MTERDGDTGEGGNATGRGLDAMLCFDLYAAHQAFGRLYKGLLDPLGLTYPQFLVMVALWQEGPMFMKEIGARLGLETNTLTPLIKRMAEASLVERQRDSADERKVRVGLTEAGRALRARAEGVPQAVGRATGLEPGEVEALRQELRRLAANLKAAAAAK
ncbi:MAG: MarR family transcriptional regulator [Paracoccaceae bacterium]